MNRLGILGGTFDPPHLAHLIAGEMAVEAFALDKLLFIPANVPPHKAGQPITSAEHRFAMTKLAVRGNEQFEVSGIELERPAPSYMIDTIREVQEQLKPESVFLFIGLDQFAAFESWNKYEDILREAQVVVMARPSHDVEKISPSLRKQVQFLSIPQLEISSTDIRARVQAGKPIRYLVPDEVREYIREHRLYQA
jgi:nicotinate-nucleotide adenylyltransferase